MSRLGFFFRMAIPLALPGVVTVAILAFTSLSMLPALLFFAVGKDH